MIILLGQLNNNLRVLLALVAQLSVGCGRISSQALFYSNDTLHIFYSTLDQRLMHVQLSDGAVVAQEVIGETKGPPQVSYDGRELRVLAPGVGIFTRRAWGWAFAPANLSQQADAWRDQVLTSDSEGVWVLYLSRDAQSVREKIRVVSNWVNWSGNWAEWGVYRYPMAFLKGLPVWFYEHTSVAYEDGDYFYSSEYYLEPSHWPLPGDPGTRVSISPEHSALVVEVEGYHHYAILFRSDTLRVNWAYRPSVHYPYLLSVDGAMTTLMLSVLESDTWRVLERRKIPEPVERLSLWWVGDSKFFALAETESHALLLWPIGYVRGPWSPLRLLSGRGKLKFLFEQEEDATYPAKIYSADGRLVRSLRVRNGDEVKLRPGAYLVRAGNYFAKGVVY